MFRNKSVIIGLVILLLVGLAGGFFLFANRSASTEEETVGIENSIQKLSSEELGLEMEVTPDKKKVRFTIAKAKDIKTIAYEVMYEAEPSAQEKSEGVEGKVPRGITGDVKHNGGSSYQSQWLDLGSCSRNVCKYDTGVESIDLILKIVKSDNNTYQAEEKLEL